MGGGVPRLKNVVKSALKKLLRQVSFATHNFFFFVAALEEQRREVLRFCLDWCAVSGAVIEGGGTKVLCF